MAPLAYDAPSWTTLLYQQPQAARAQAQRWVADAQAGMERVSAQGLLAQALAACGELEQALSTARQCEEQASREADAQHVVAQLFLADILRQLGWQEACQAMLRAAFERARREGFDETLPDLPEMMARLCSEALDAGVEIDYVKRLIRLRQLRPHKADTPHWPWPVRIFTLGGFYLVCEDQPLAFNGKSPRKALDLLQALIAQGGREVHTTRLMQTVWPDESSSNLRNLFDNTLHRLRRLLGHNEVLHLHDAKLTLDADHCWVDAWAFEHLTTSRVHGSEDGSRREDAFSESGAQAALRLYQGHFLQSEAEQPWSLPYRDRLRNRFQRLVRALGARLESAGQWEAAIEVYERGIEIDNLAESFYQRLMFCHHQRGEHAESVRVYRRCRELLSIVLGISPSAATEEIRRACVQSAS
ncbi:BTAD domain-containing putative transcriptional regulator [Ramlibacter sp. 2FC]|uniref:AfsR/SARP family transcriptional regulator n=1 Tax=Ramlibacter sp. 2FC TaxID=2502188 RepID=UPI0014851183|nr:BTAD domain-containing putative transcriptional regulator [Ramlibacter sp. 2FC]